MTGRIEGLETYAFDIDVLSIADPDGDHVGFGLLAHHRDAPRTLAQRGKASDMVGVQMCIDRFYQPQVQLLQELNVTINLFEEDWWRRLFLLELLRPPVVA